MNSKEKIIKLIIVLLSIFLVFILYEYFSLYKRNEKISKVDKNDDVSDSQLVNELKQEIGITGKNELYEIKIEYDGNKVLNIKPEIQYKIAFAGIVTQTLPKIEEIDSIYKNNYPLNSGIWIETNSRTRFLEIIKENTNNEYTITDDGFLKIKNESNPNDEDKALKNLIFGKNKYIIIISGIYYEADQVTGKILDNYYEELDPYQASKIVENDNDVIIFLTTNKEKNFTSKEILNELTAFYE